MKVKKILVSQPQPATGKSPYYDIADRFDAEVVFRPFIRVDPVTEKEFRSQRVNLPDYSAVIFTAKTAIDHYFHFCKVTRFAVPDTMRYFCTTESVALYLQKYITYRKRKIAFGRSGKLQDLQPQLIKHKSETFLVPVSDVHSGEQESFLSDLGINHKLITLYHTVCNDFSKEEAFDYDALVFFTPAGIESLFKNFPDFKQNGIAIGALGEAACKAVKEAGLELSFHAPQPGIPSMTAALEKYLEENNR